MLSKNCFSQKNCLPSVHNRLISFFNIFENLTVFEHNFEKIFFKFFEKDCKCSETDISGVKSRGKKKYRPFKKTVKIDFRTWFSKKFLASLTEEELLYKFSKTPTTCFCFKRLRRLKQKHVISVTHTRTDYTPL